MIRSSGRGWGGRGKGGGEAPRYNLPLRRGEGEQGGGDEKFVANWCVNDWPAVADGGPGADHCFQVTTRKWKGGGGGRGEKGLLHARISRVASYMKGRLDGGVLYSIISFNLFVFFILFVYLSVSLSVCLTSYICLSFMIYLSNHLSTAFCSMPKSPLAFWCKNQIYVYVFLKASLFDFIINCGLTDVQSGDK